jgi:D-glycero-D-manno-heptose 1,7-bisphosphate phosphatase
MALMTAQAQGSSNAGTAHLRRAVFLDKDGTLVENVPYNVDPACLRLTPHAAQGLRMLADHGYRLIVVTNQSGIARGYFDRAALDRVHDALGAMLRAEGVHIDDYLVCPHAPAAFPSSPECACRKPKPGLLQQAAQRHGIDLRQSWMIGDILNDVEAGHRAGCRAILMDVGNETEWQMTPQRQPDLRVSDLLEAARAITAEHMLSIAMREGGANALSSLSIDTL